MPFLSSGLDVGAVLKDGVDAPQLMEWLVYDYR